MGQPCAAPLRLHVNTPEIFSLAIFTYLFHPSDKCWHWDALLYIIILLYQGLGEGPNWIIYEQH